MPAYLRAGAVFHPIFAKQFAVLIPLAAKPVQPPVAIKFLRRQLCVVMPGASAPMPVSTRKNVPPPRLRHCGEAAVAHLFLVWRS